MKNALLLFCSISISLLLGEYLLRKAFPYKLNSINHQGPVAYEFDEDYLLRLKANSNKKFYRTKWNGGQAINWHVNSNGYRGPELRANPKHRIVVYGDSNIQARFSNLENTYTEQLRQQIAKGGFLTEVINAGIIGMGPDQMLLKFQKEINNLQPDIAIFNVFCDNDFGDLLRNRLFDLDENGKLSATNFPRQVDEYLLWSEKEKNQFQSLFFEETIVLINRIFGEKENPEKESQYIAALSKLCEEEYQAYESNQASGCTHFQDHYDLDLAIDPDGKAGLLKQQLMAAVLDSIYQVGKENGVVVLFQLLPSAIDISCNHIVGKEELTVLSSKYTPRTLTNKVVSICEKQEMFYLNLYDVFEEAGANKLYFLEDDHWNDEGQALAAKAMSTMLLQRGFLPSANTISKLQ